MSNIKVPELLAPTGLSAEQLRDTLLLVESDNVSLCDVAERLEQDPQLRRQLFAFANSTTNGRKLRVDNAVHAAAFVGARRIANLIRNQLDLIETTAAEAEHRQVAAQTTEHSRAA